MSPANNEVSQDMLRSIEIVRPMFAELERVAGYSAAAPLTGAFSKLHKLLLEAEPLSLAHLSGGRPSRVDWLKRFRSAILDSLQEGIYATSYHLSRIEVIESSMLRIAEAYVPKLGASPTSSIVAGGNSRALNFEYQAFAFALRRSLEYLGFAMAAYFKRDCHSIRALPKIIENAEPLERSTALQAVLRQHMQSLQDVIPTDKENKRSLRDRLAHWEAVGAGCFNLSRGPSGYSIGIVGGGHDLRLTPDRQFSERIEVTEPTVKCEIVGPALRSQFERVNTFAWACMASLGLHEAV